jgi:outer membrane receptor for ferrienterochelin and colicins
VVVTASGSQQWIKDAPASISVISREDIERQPVPTWPPCSAACRA